MIETDRLHLRRWKPADLDDYAAICGDPEVMRWIGDGNVKTRGQTEDDIAEFERRWDERGFGLFALELKTSGRLSGFVGLSIPGFLPEILPSVEIGWRLDRSLWGKGLATEGARSAMGFGFNEIGLDRIVSICQVENRASRRIMEKLEMSFDREMIVPGSGVPVQVYAIEKSEWK